MKSPRNLPAFTLSELLVVLLLTIVVVGLAYSVLNLVQKQLHGVREHYREGSETNRLRQSLWTDFRTFSYIQYSEASSALECNNAMSSVRYQFGEQYILRNSDTLHVAMDTLVLYHDGIPVRGGMVNAIKIKLKGQNVAPELFIFKPNTAEIYMN